MSKTITLAIFLTACFSLALAQGQHLRAVGSGFAIGSDAIWQPGMEGFRQIKTICSSAPNVGNCFARKMKEQGASQAAVAFTRLIDNNGYLRDFREAGAVDIAYVNYPFRANETQGCLLVNGSPQIIDVDDAGNIAQNVLLKNPHYAALAQRYPQIAIFPGDRSGTDFPIARNTGNGQRFIVTYKLVNGCHACEQIGTLRLAFDFDKNGRFLGTEFHEMN